MLDVKWVKGHDGLLSIKKEWHELREKVANRAFYNSWGWHTSLSTYLKTENIYYFIVLDETTPVAIFPLEYNHVSKLGLKWNTFKFIDHPHLPLADALIHPGENAESIYTALYACLTSSSIPTWQLLTFSRLRKRSNLSQFFSRLDAKVSTLKYSYYLRVGAGTEGLSSLSKKRMKNIRYCLRKSEENFESLTFEFVEDSGKIQRAFDEFLALEASGWKGAQGEGTCISLDENLLGFYQSLISHADAEGGVVISRMVADGKLIASQFFVRENKRWNLLKMAYDESFHKISPGNVLLYKLLLTLNESSSECEMSLVTGPSWADIWRFNKEPTHFVTFYNRSIQGRLAKFLFEFKAKVLNR